MGNTSDKSTETDKIKKKSVNGGRRPGAGRKPGAKNKLQAQCAIDVAATGITPLEFMLQTMRNAAPDGLEGPALASWECMRFEAAKAAAPYVHAKLAAIELTGKDKGPLQVILSAIDAHI